MKFSTIFMAAAAAATVSAAPAAEPDRQRTPTPVVTEGFQPESWLPVGGIQPGAAEFGGRPNWPKLPKPTGTFDFPHKPIFSNEPKPYTVKRAMPQAKRDILEA